MRTIRFFILFITISVFGCFNPFFPEMGNPPLIPSSPERTIQLFKEAYERKDFSAFKDLIYSTDDFSSYIQVSGNYTATLGKILTSPQVFIDSIFPLNNFLMPNSSYYELKWTEEERIHRKMFAESESILFLSLTVSDKLFEIDEIDTISALVKTYPSKISIILQGEEFTADVTGQIFAMKRKNGIWKIWKWIELN